MGLVQSASGSSTGTTLTITLPAAVQSYHGVIAACCGYAGGVISGITLGTLGGTFTRQATSGTVNAEIWANLKVSDPRQFSDTITITASRPGIIAYVYEAESPQQAAGQASGVYGLQNVALDKAAGQAASSGTSWSSGVTGTTVSGSELVIGLGFLLGNAGTITGPSSGGWANEAAVTDVTAGGYTYGAVSGCQVPSAAGTYDYAGTSGSGGIWAGVTATFLLMPCGEVGWSGYIWQPEQAPPGGYTGITATWTIPSYAATPAGGSCSIWVGLGNAFPQIGVYCTFSASDPGNNSLALWSFYEPGGVFWDAATFPVAVGDSLTCTITVDDTYFYMTMANGTQDWSYTDQKSIQSLMPNSTDLAMPKSAAEIIIEDEGGAAGKLPNYGTVAFTGISVTPTPLGAPVPWAFVNETITQLPGPYSGDSFTMTWESQT